MEKFGSGIRDAKFGSGIRDGKISDPGSGINIPDPQHCSVLYFINAYVVDCLTTCPALNLLNGTLEEGEEQVMETAGCCPHWRRVCRQERCAPPSACPAHLVRTVNTSTLHNCCAKYTCGKVKLYS
jgi:hypothetical protein